MNEYDKPALVENMLLMRREDFDELLNCAAERGAEKVNDSITSRINWRARNNRQLRTGT